MPKTWLRMGSGDRGMKRQTERQNPFNKKIRKNDREIIKVQSEDLSDGQSSRFWGLKIQNLGNLTWIPSIEAAQSAVFYK